MIAILLDDVVIPDELVGKGIPPLLVVANVAVVMEEVYGTTVLLETIEYKHK